MVQAGQSVAADRKSGQKSLFGGLDEEETPAARATASLPDTAEWTDRERAQKEKEVLGFYLTSHPLDEHKPVLATYRSHTTADVPALKERDEVILGGMISAVKLSHTKNPQPGKPSRYAMFDLEDVDGIIRCILWPEQYAEMGHLVVPETVLLVRGVIDRRGGEEANLVVNELMPLDQLDSRFTTGIVVRLHEAEHGEDTLGKVREILRTYPGNSELQLLLQLDGGTRVHLRSHRTRLEVNREVRARLDDLLGPGNIQLLTTPPKPAANAGPRRRYGGAP